MASNNINRVELSVVTAAFNEGDNLGLLYQKLVEAMAQCDVSWEWIVVDDHSTDHTPQVLRELVGRDARVRVCRLARNSGAHLALLCGLNRARGDCAIDIAGDLQDSPGVIALLLQAWREGNQIVWGARKSRPEGVLTLFLSRLFYSLMRKLDGPASLPLHGSDCFLIDRTVIRALRHFKEAQLNVISLIAWMGFRQTTLYFDKNPRLHGKSKWTLEKKLKLFVDSVASFSYKPIRLMSYTGFAVAGGGFLYALDIVLNSYRGNPPQGWSSIMVALLVLGGFIMIMLGILGEYLWRALQEARNRPQYLIESYFDHGLLAQGETKLAKRA